MASSKSAFVEVTCFPGAYNIDADREKAYQNEIVKKQEEKEHIHSYKKAKRQGVVKRFIKALPRGIYLIAFLLSYVLIYGLALLFMLSSTIIAALLLYWLLGLLLNNQSLQLFIVATIAFSLVDVVTSIIKDKTDSIFSTMASVPAKIYKFLELSHLLRVALFISITVADLTNSTLYFNQNTWF